MDDYALDPHGQMLLEEYRESLPDMERLGEIVTAKLEEAIAQNGIVLNTIERRIKSEKSMAGKLKRKGAKYSTIDDVTDVLGIRIITFFNEDVDRIASIAESLFRIDWDNSVDKRKTHQFDSFGYNSLHYICQMPPELMHDEKRPRLNEIRFELQMRTALQHVWSAIQHDIGYKTDIETPMEYHRALSRLAGLLELADNEFSRIRHDLADYRRRAQLLIEGGQLSEVTLNADTLKSYLEQRPFDKLNRRIAAINQAELYAAPTADYLTVMRNMGLNTLADVDTMLRDNAEDAYQLALLQLGSTDIDILADTIALQNLCIVTILKNGGGRAGLKRMFDTIYGPAQHNEETAQMILKQAERLSFMSNNP
jgi:ppGpp synthetase/RelA/SpoT-type nucleotidyltranferase